MDNFRRKQDYIARWSALKNERSSWDAVARNVARYFFPQAGRFEPSQHNKGNRKGQDILDSTCIKARRILVSGLMSGMTSPARPWFRLTTEDFELAEYPAVRQWLDDVRNLMLQICSRSNTYQALPMMYNELVVFGTAANIFLEDYDNVLSHQPLTFGQFAIATEFRGTPTTVYRELRLTTAQMVREFGYDNCPGRVRSEYDRGSLDVWHDVLHIIEPREDRNLNSPLSRDKKWASIYLYPADDRADFLRESGFDIMPMVAPRWEVISGNIYGFSPAMEALGDTRQLQHEQLRKANLIDYRTKPPLQVPTNLRGHEVQMLPGGVTYYDPVSGPNSGIRSLFEVNLDPTLLLEDIRDVRERINDAFFVNLFLAITQLENTNRTATEIAARNEEKMLILGPVLEQLHNELLDPFIDWMFERMVRANILPPPPPELLGQEVKVEYISMLAQAQRAIGAANIDRYLGTVASVASVRPDIVDNLDADRLAVLYADILGVDPDLVLPSEQVALIREARAQQQQAMAQAELMKTQSEAARNLGSVPSVNSGERTGLTDVADAFSGYRGAGLDE